MRFATIILDGREQASVEVDDHWVPLATVDRGLAGDLLTLIDRMLSPAELSALASQARALPEGNGVPAADARFSAPYRRPRKIWGIGLNYAEHAADLDAVHPDQPASFIKGDHTIIGPGDQIVLPPQSQRVTAEAELGLVIGTECRDVAESEALDVLFGVCAILDQTAEDILQMNARYLTRSKNFPTFFSFGPEIVTIDELLADGPLADVSVATWRNGAPVRTQPIANMRHSPRSLVSFHSQMMPLFPGDVISTGTPGAAVIHPGDWVECRVAGLAPLRNPVTDGR